MSHFSHPARRSSTHFPRTMIETLESRTLLSASPVTACPPQIPSTPCGTLAIRQNLCTIAAVTGRVRVVQAPLVIRNGLPATPVNIK
jgi:hypothetical protein